MNQDKINPEDLALIDSVVKKVGIKLFIEYFGAACWVGEDHEEDTKHLIEAFASNIADDALKLIEKTENGEFEKIRSMVFDHAMETYEVEQFKNLMNSFTNTNLPDISRLAACSLETYENLKNHFKALDLFVTNYYFVGGNADNEWKFVFSDGTTLLAIDDENGNFSFPAYAEQIYVKAAQKYLDEEKLKKEK